MFRKHRSGYVTAVLLSVVVIAVILVLVFKDSLISMGSGGTNQFVITEPVVQGDLLVTVTEDGTLESAANVEVKCEVAGGSSILWIIDDGENVKKGDKIIELDSSTLEDQIIAQQNVLETAKASKIQAENDYKVAVISVDEYKNGIFKKEMTDADTQITIADENLSNAENSLEHSEKMFRKGYLSELELAAQKFAVKRSNLEAEAAKAAKSILQDYTYKKMLEDLESKVVTADAKRISEERSFELESNKLTKLESQKKNCIVYAPQDGMVVYANSKSRWGQQH